MDRAALLETLALDAIDVVARLESARQRLSDLADRFEDLNKLYTDEGGEG